MGFANLFRRSRLPVLPRQKMMTMAMVIVMVTDSGTCDYDHAVFSHKGIAEGTIFSEEVRCSNLE